MVLGDLPPIPGATPAAETTVKPQNGLTGMVGEGARFPGAPKLGAQQGGQESPTPVTEAAGQSGMQDHIDAQPADSPNAAIADAESGNLSNLAEGGATGSTDTLDVQSPTDATPAAPTADEAPVQAIPAAEPVAATLTESPTNEPQSSTPDPNTNTTKRGIVGRVGDQLDRLGFIHRLNENRAAGAEKRAQDALGPVDRAARILSQSGENLDSTARDHLRPHLAEALKAAGVEMQFVGGATAESLGLTGDAQKIFNELLESVQIKLLSEARSGEKFNTKDRKIVVTKDGDDIVVTTLSNTSEARTVINAQTGESSTQQDKLVIDPKTGEISSSNAAHKGLDFDFTAYRMKVKEDGHVLFSSTGNADKKPTDLASESGGGRYLSGQLDHVRDIVDRTGNNALHYNRRVWIKRSYEAVDGDTVADEVEAVRAAAANATNTTETQVVSLPESPQIDRGEGTTVTLTTVDVRPATDLEGRKRADAEIKRDANNKLAEDPTKWNGRVHFTGDEKYRGIAQEVNTGTEVPDKEGTEQAKTSSGEGKTIEGSQADADRWNKLTADTKKTVLVSLGLEGVDPALIDFRVPNPDQPTSQADIQLTDKNTGALRSAADKQDLLQADIERGGVYLTAALEGNADGAAVIFSLNPKAEGASLKAADAALQTLETSIRNAIDNGQTEGLSEYQYAQKRYAETFRDAINGDETKQQRVEQLAARLHKKSDGERLSDAVAARIDGEQVKNVADLRTSMMSMMEGIPNMTLEAKERMVDLQIGALAQESYNNLYSQQEISAANVASFRERFGDDYRELGDALEAKLPKVTTANDLLAAATSADALDRFAEVHPDMRDQVDALKVKLFPEPPAQKTLQEKIQDGTVSLQELEGLARALGANSPMELVTAIQRIQQQNNQS